ncbi:MAG: deoxynucleoside kinase [Cytophagales bacterium]|nr:deoxynucleoside kinase [Cytophagales bacterium]
MHIAVAGNIGVGKSTLSRKLAKHFGWKLEMEDVEHNPYLSDFYADMKKWAFHLEIYFLKSRFFQMLRIRESSQMVIQDRTIYEGAHIFAKNLYDSQLLEERDYKTYTTLFGLMKNMIAPPDLMIYLKADTPKLVKQINMRGNDYESGIPINYLQNLNDQYEEWMTNYTEGKLLVVDVNEMDFENRPEDFASILEGIDKELNGLF